jgi:serine/threonine-protein kinase
LNVARQIAEALAAAHEQGVIHRDLKPANVKVRPDGIVKVLDFGLATWRPTPAQAASSSGAAFEETASMQTMPGVVLGTAAYMAPEQARGLPVDRRADVWAFGCVLFEMLAGRRAFEGRTLTDVLVKIIGHEPEWDALPPTVPARVRRLLRHCLQKDPAQRLDSATAARLEIVDAMTPEPAASGPPPATAPVPRWRRAAPAAGAAIAAAAAGMLGTWLATRPAPAPTESVTRFEIVPPPGQPIAFSFAAPDLVVSADGTRLAYTSGAERQLMVRDFDAVDAVIVPGVTDARAPFFSPDGQSIGYFDQSGNLKRVSVTGGPSITICRVTGVLLGAAWAPNDTIVFATQTSGGLLRVSASGGEPERLTSVDASAGEVAHAFPSMLPDGRGVLFTSRRGNSGEWRLAVLDTASNQIKRLVRGGLARYVDTGHLIASIDAALWAVPFDLDRLEVTGEPVPVVEEVAQFSGTSQTASFSVSGGGTLAYIRPTPDTTRSIVWVSRQGAEEPVALPQRSYRELDLSPDRSRLAAVVRGSENNDIWSWDLSSAATSSAPTRLTFDAGGSFPVWAPDGRHIYFGSSRSGRGNVYRRPADGVGADERLTTSSNNQRPTTVSPDGRRLVIEEGTTETGWDLVEVLLDGTARSRPLLNSQSAERNAAISPDGRWLAYESDESGRVEVYVRPFPNVDDGRYDVSTDGGRTPAWSPNGRELFFANGTRLLAAAVQLSPAFRASTPTVLFERSSIVFDDRLRSGGGNQRTYDVGEDGQRFLMIRQGESAAGLTIVVVRNWDQELRAMAPGRR